jgi:hypothetical protein
VDRERNPEARARFFSFSLFPPRRAPPPPPPPHPAVSFPDFLAATRRGNMRHFLAKPRREKRGKTSRVIRDALRSSTISIESIVLRNAARFLRDRIAITQIAPTPHRSCNILSASACGLNKIRGEGEARAKCAVKNYLRDPETPSRIYNCYRT